MVYTFEEKEGEEKEKSYMLLSHTAKSFLLYFLFPTPPPHCLSFSILIPLPIRSCPCCQIEKPFCYYYYYHRNLREIEIPALEAKRNKIVFMV